MTEQRKYCGKCGATVVSDSEFCSACGTDLTRFEGAAASPDGSTSYEGDRPSKASSSQNRQAETVRRDSVASVADRFGAAVLDTVYLGAAIFVLPTWAAAAGWSEERSTAVFLVSVVVVIGLFVMECLPLTPTEAGGAEGAASLGKRTLGLRIQPWAQHEGGNPSYLGRFLLRTLVLAIPILNLVCLVAMALDRHHRAWYDEMTGTVVVKVR